MSWKEGNSSSQSFGVLLKDLFQCCRSAFLSESSLRAIIEQHLSDGGLRAIIERGVAPNSDDPRCIDFAFFHWACFNERVTEGILRCLLEYFPNAARYIDIAGQLPLHIALGNKNVTLGMVQLLIDAFPESIRREDNDGRMPLHLLCAIKNLDDDFAVETLKLLIEGCPGSVRHVVFGDALPIHFAAEIQSPEFCRLLIEAYPGSEQLAAEYGYLPFHLACRHNGVATAKYLYQLYPESINVTDNNGRSPIHYAITGLKDRSNPKEVIEVVRFLQSCNPDALSSTGKTPLHIVCFNNNVTLRIVKLLIDAFPDSVRHRENMGRMPLHYLCGNNNLDDKEDGLKILKLLIETCPESVRHAAEGGTLPIHFAAAWNSPEFCRILIEAYPGSERMTDGYLPFHMACGLNTVEVVKYFYQLYPESINVAVNGRWCPILYAIEGITNRKDNSGTAVEIVQFLLDCDPNVVLQKHQDAFPLYWVCVQATRVSDDTSKLNAYLKVLQILYDAHPDAIDEETSNVDRYCEEVQTFINTQLTYARQAKDRTLMHSPDENGQIPLHKAFHDNATIALGSIKLLVKGNPSAITCADKNGMMPLHVACQHHGSPSIVEYLLDLDPSSSHVLDFDDNTMLHHACLGANHAVITLLLDKKYGSMSVSKRNAHGQLPIDLLLENNEFCDEESVEYTESIYRLLRANPETITNSII